MPRYFITTTDGPSDEEGVHVKDRATLSTLLRLALTEILRDEGPAVGDSEFAAEARDEAGRPVMSARISFSVVD